MGAECNYTQPGGRINSKEVFEILFNQVKERGIGALVATHNFQLAEQMDRTLELKSGQLIAH